MPALKMKALTLLGSASLVITTGGALTLYTTPPGKLTRISHIVARNPTASCTGATQIRFGTGFNNNGNNDISTMTTSGTDYMVLANTLKSTEIAASTAVQMTPTTGTIGACTVTFDVFGFEDTV